MVILPDMECMHAAAGAAKTPKLPTRLGLGDTVTIYGRTLTVVEVRDEDGRGHVVVSDGVRRYLRSTYFVAHKNMWRSLWLKQTPVGG